MDDEGKSVYNQTILHTRALKLKDDGGKSVYNQTILHTRALKLEDVEYLQSVLSENFGLRTRLEEKKKDQWVIYIPVMQKTKLREIVGHASTPAAQACAAGVG